MNFTIEINNYEVLSYLEREKERGLLENETLHKIIEVGVAVLERLNSKSETDYLKLQVAEINSGLNKFMEDLPRGIAAHVRESFDPELEGSYTSHISAQLEKIRKLFDETNTESFQVKIGKNLEETADTIRQMLDGDNVTSFASFLKDFVKTEFGEGSLAEQKMEELVAGFEKSITAHFEKLEEKLQKIQVLEEVKDKMFSKGSSYEDTVYRQLTDLASSRQDIVERVGNTTAAGCNSKKGDFTYIFKSGSTVVVEAKNRRMTLSDVHKELNTSIKTRGAYFGIMVFPQENLPGGIQHLGISENRIVTTERYLCTALHIAHALDQIVPKQDNNIAYDQLCKSVRSVFTEVDSSRTRIGNLKKHISTNLGIIESTIDNAVDGLNAMLILLAAGKDIKQNN